MAAIAKKRDVEHRRRNHWLPFVRRNWGRFPVYIKDMPLHTLIGCQFCVEL
ncbi:conserved hypothetical protein [Trichinella spiralis]|uniref:hypothetical protein n=1 Tax=Trichinella spiralis TaxID=6334 RepID=UPI0001EFD177|nr:conserved hypothetical protein [Trichinella spiralis]